ncbi:MAG: hypothetical protein LBD70_01185 [Bifidobacteriaceae bacterium]|nr:hypothetical protein [Bifidobacteriaceae bacterium]
MTADGVRFNLDDYHEGSELDASLVVESGAVLVTERVWGVGVANSGLISVRDLLFGDGELGPGPKGITNLPGGRLVFEIDAALSGSGTFGGAKADGSTYSGSIGASVIVNQGTIVNKGRFAIKGGLVNDGTVDNTAGVAYLNSNGAEEPEMVSDSPQYSFEVERAVLLAALYRLDGSEPSPTPTPSGSGPAEGDLSVAVDSPAAVQGELLELTLKGFEAAEQVEIGLQSDYRKLAVWTVDGAGGLTDSVTLPGDLSVGAHTIGATGLGSGRVAVTKVEVTAKSSSGPTASSSGGAGGTLPVSGQAAPAWPLSLAALMLVGAGAGAGLVWRRRALAG